MMWSQQYTQFYELVADDIVRRGRAIPQAASRLGHSPHNRIQKQSLASELAQPVFESVCPSHCLLILY